MLATFPLIWMGGLVTTHGVGLAVPDWPNSFGYNMFLLPWDRWREWGVFHEHTHRLLGTLVGLLAIFLVAAAWISKRTTRTQKWLSIIVLLAVIIQGVLGGLRVVLTNLNLAVVHGIFAQASLCLMGLMIVISSSWWQSAPDLSETEPETGRELKRLTVFTVVLIFAQLIVAAIMRHYQAGLAIPDFPLNYGHILPPISQEGLNLANASRMADPALGQVTLAQIWLQFAHRIGAVIVTAALIWTTLRILRRTLDSLGLRGMSISLHILITIQLTLGILTVLMRKPADVASAHVAVGALLLLITFMLTTRVFRLYGGHTQHVEHGFPVMQTSSAANPGAALQ